MKKQPLALILLTLLLIIAPANAEDLSGFDGQNWATPLADNLGVIELGKAQKLNLCVEIASISAAIQNGRRTHKHEYPQFVALIPPMLRADGQSLQSIRLIMTIGQKIFETYPMSITPGEMFETIYTLCVSGDVELM